MREKTDIGVVTIPWKLSFFCRSSEAEVTEEVKVEEVKAIELLLEEKSKLLLEEKAKLLLEEKAKEAVKDLQKSLQTPLTGG